MLNNSEFSMKTDPLTKQQFRPRRSNQVFETTENRIIFHNLRANKLRKEKAFIDKPLHRNQKILSELMKNEKEKKFHKQFLLGKGFNFMISTHTEEVENKKHYAVYQYAIIPLENEQIKILLYD